LLAAQLARAGNKQEEGSELVEVLAAALLELVVERASVAASSELVPSVEEPLAVAPPELARELGFVVPYFCFYYCRLHRKYSIKFNF
jgi:hypothetical protein